MRYRSPGQRSNRSAEQVLRQAQSRSAVIAPRRTVFVAPTLTFLFVRDRADLHVIRPDHALTHGIDPHHP